ncbi:MAG: NAD-dependent epimerase/dehydratase family protein, partial [Caldilineaceae bacterium]|nr:NAD-dependent epimerase/dehydratase family protein [Caldilineaceae bacterium]
MRIGVTGGSGAIGRYVCDELLKVNHDVVSLDRIAPSGAIGGDAGYIEVDLSDLEASCAALTAFDQIVHLAAIPDPYFDPPVKVISVNTAINFCVFEAARLNGIPRVIYGCSDS